MRTRTVISELERDPEYDATYAEAADWFARLHDGEVTVEETMQWQHLMAQRPTFAAAYARITEVWNALEAIPIAPPVASLREQGDRYDGSVPVSSWLNRKRAPRLPRWTAALLAACLAGVAVGSWLIFGSTSSGYVLQTPRGQNQAFILADGSRINLGANTRLEIKLGTNYRRVDLIRGEAFFAVAKDPRRPFTVRSGDASVTAVGTEFSVNRASDQVVIAVIEGRVVVAAGEAAEDPAYEPLQKRQLDAGEKISLGILTGGAGKSIDSVAMPVGWQDGRLAFQSEPLSRVLVDVNRYAPKPISVDDPTLGDLMITGTVLRDDMPGWLASLEKAFPLKVVDGPQGVTIRSR
jgi:transmembrane sensor